ncbi:elongation factor Tu, mitochondrial-like [Dorcoceras hygrometricum]|uniref:Elongation factor Tu, mitochondrial-like n=1 Tax=Dorcoceras hygrometricum TaxID=472368 RepID=A0A2Z7D9X0_9LAMI|nr:elongation factor Tu, mitochondrial-like [Dorcoceras hygrometricum]
MCFLVHGSEGIWKPIVNRIRGTIGDSIVGVLLLRKIGIVGAGREVESVTLLASRRLDPTSFTGKPALQRLAAVDLLIRSTTGNRTPSSACTRRPDEFTTDEISSSTNREASTCMTLNGSGIQLAVGSQLLRLRNHNFGLTHRIMVKRLATSPHDLLGITDSACKNQSVMVSVQYGPFNTYIPIRSTTIGISRVARDPIAMHTSWR